VYAFSCKRGGGWFIFSWLIGRGEKEKEIITTARGAAGGGKMKSVSFRREVSLRLWGKAFSTQWGGGGGEMKRGASSFMLGGEGGGEGGEVASPSGGGAVWGEKLLSEKRGGEGEKLLLQRGGRESRERER